MELGEGPLAIHCISFSSYDMRRISGAGSEGPEAVVGQSVYVWTRAHAMGECKAKCAPPHFSKGDPSTANRIYSSQR